MAYQGSVTLIAGLIPKNNGKFPLVNAHDVYVDDDTRLDEALDRLDEFTWDSPARNDQANGITELHFDPAAFGVGQGASVTLTTVKLTATNNAPAWNQDHTEVTTGLAGAGLWTDLVMEVYKKDGVALASADVFRLQGTGTFVGSQQEYQLTGEGGPVTAGHVYTARFFATDSEGNEVAVRGANGEPYVNADNVTVSANYVAGLGLSLYNAAKSGASQDLVGKVYCTFNGAINTNLAPTLSVVYKSKVLADSKARSALASIAQTINSVVGSGTDGKWTLADCSAAIQSIATTIATALTCVAIMVCAGCVGDQPPALKVAGPHGYTHFEDMDPVAEVLTYDEIVALIHERIAEEVAGLQNDPAYVTNVNTKAFIGSGYYINWDEEHHQMDVYKSDLGD